MRLSPEEARGLGASLRRVKPELVRPLPDGERIWWVGDERYLEASAHLDDEGAITFFELSVRGREVRLARSVKTGDTGDLDFDPSGMPAAKLVTDDRELDEALVESVVLLLRAAGDELLDRVAEALTADLAARRGV